MATAAAVLVVACGATTSSAIVHASTPLLQGHRSSASVRPRALALGCSREVGEKPPLQLEIEQRFRLRSAGLAVGCTLLASATALAVGADMIDLAGMVEPLRSAVAPGAVAWALVTLSYEEFRQPLDDAVFEVKESPGCGQGLFAKIPISKGTFLFDYTGEVLRGMDELFARYPEGGGPYIACINSNLYIDGADAAASGIARWMNHRRNDPNVVSRKQRFGPRPAMHFYTLRDIAVGEELVFNYGDEYWEALGCEPMPE